MIAIFATVHNTREYTFHIAFIRTYHQQMSIGYLIGNFTKGLSQVLNSFFTVETSKIQKNQGACRYSQRGSQRFSYIRVFFESLCIHSTYGPIAKHPDL